MGWFGGAKTAEAEAFAREITEEFVHHYPIDRAGAGGADERKLSHAIEILGNRASKFNLQHPMGWYRRACFMGVIKEELQARGAPEALVDAVVYAVTLRIAQRQLPGRAAKG